MAAPPDVDLLGIEIDSCFIGQQIVLQQARLILKAGPIEVNVLGSVPDDQAISRTPWPGVVSGQLRAAGEIRSR